MPYFAEAARNKDGTHNIGWYDEAGGDERILGTYINLAEAEAVADEMNAQYERDRIEYACLEDR